MLPFMKVAPTGFCYKNITFPLYAGTDTYGLSSTNALGLSPSSLCVGISIRSNGRSGSAKSVKGNVLLPKPIIDGSQLTLKDIETKDIISGMPVLSKYDNDNDGGAFTIYFEPRLAREIDWERSSIKFPAAYLKGIKGGQDYEIIVMYFDKESACSLTNSTEFRTGLQLEPLRTKQLEVLQRTGTDSYSLAKNSTIGIDRDSVLVGLYLNLYGLVSNSSEILPTNVESAFLKLKRFQTDIVDSFPIALGCEAIRPSLGSNNQSLYIPIQPTKVGEIDWEASSLFCADASAIVNNASCLFQLAYVRQTY
jgi:hypothetical protein